MQFLLGALIAGLFGLAGILYQSRHERDRWLKDRRLDAYADFMSVTSIYLSEVSVGRDPWREWPDRGKPGEEPLWTRLTETTETMLLLASPETSQLAGELTLRLMRQKEAADDETIDDFVSSTVAVRLSAQRDLGVRDTNRRLYKDLTNRAPAFLRRRGEE